MCSSIDLHNKVTHHSSKNTAINTQLIILIVKQKPSMCVCKKMHVCVECHRCPNHTAYMIQVDMPRHAIFKYMDISLIFCTIWDQHIITIINISPHIYTNWRELNMSIHMWFLCAFLDVHYPHHTAEISNGKKIKHDTKNRRKTSAACKFSTEYFIPLQNAHSMFFS